MSAEAERPPATAALHPVAAAVRVVLGLLLLGMVALNVAGAMCRYILGIVFVGADELLVFTMIWMVMVGMIVVTADRSHIALDFLVTRVSPRRRIALSVLHHVVMTGACAYATVYCWSFVMRVAAIGQTSMALELPMAIPHFALVVGFGGTTIASALLAASDISALLSTPATGRPMIWTLAVLPLTLLALGAPIFALFLAGAALTFAFFLTVPPVALHQIMFGGMENYALLAVPFFIFAGELMGGSGIADRLIAWVLALIGRIPGSLGVATVGACTLIGAISGASTATVAVVGRALYPSLVRDGYGTRFSAGLVSSSGSIDIVIPPSIAMVLYGASAEQSIAKLFAAGVLPGLLIAFMMSAYVVVMALRIGVRTATGFDARHFLRTTYEAGPALLMPVFILSGIYLGWFSPTEAGGFACLYAIIVGRYVYRTMDWGGVLDAAIASAMITAQILVIVAAAALFSWILTINGVPLAITNGLKALDLAPWAFLMVVNVILLIVGCFLDPTSAIIVLTPLFIPLVKALGIDPIHFGIVMTVNIAIGMFTPPFGLNLFVAQSVLGVPLDTLYRGVLPFAVVQIAALLVITYWPALSLAITWTF